MTHSILATALLMILPAHAGILRLTGMPELKASLENDSVRVQSEFDFKNEGDEEILEVYPVLFRGQWKWAAPEQRLPVGKSAHWKLNELIPIHQFIYANESKHGIYPVSLWRHYKDINGYPFSAPEILPIELGELTSSERSTIKTQGLISIPVLPQSLTPGQSFKLKYKLKSDATQDVKARIYSFSTREVQTQVTEAEKTLKPGENAEIAVKVKNVSGLNDSSYPVFIVAEYELNGIHAYTHGMQFVRIGPEDRFYFWLMVGGGLGLLMVLGSFLFLRKKRS